MRQIKQEFKDVEVVGMENLSKKDAEFFNNFINELKKELHKDTPRENYSMSIGVKNTSDKNLVIEDFQATSSKKNEFNHPEKVKVSFNQDGKKDTLDINLPKNTNKFSITSSPLFIKSYGALYCSLA